MAYVPRIVDGELGRLLDVAGFVLIEGAKGVGKTETAKQAARSWIALDASPNARELAAGDPATVLAGEVPRLIDEWQLSPTIWNHVRRAVDDRQDPGQFILTGSAVPADDVTRHSGAGRMLRLQMRPMTLAESGHSSGEISVSTLFDGDRPRAGDTGFRVSDAIERICIGGWPRFVTRDAQGAQRLLRGYLGEIARTDIHSVDGVRRDPRRVSQLLRSLARNTATQVSDRALAADASGSGASLHPRTVGEYLDALERLMVIENVPAWAPTLRSRARLRAAPTRYFTDPCLAIAALGGSPAGLLRDIEFAGFLFENLVVRDLRVYLQHLGAQFAHYRDSNDLEIDVIIELDDGRWAALEVKLGVNRVDAAAANLRKFANVVDTSRVGEPVFLGVVTASGFGYRRQDGVYVLPICTLGP